MTSFGAISSKINNRSRPRLAINLHNGPFLAMRYGDRSKFLSCCLGGIRSDYDIAVRGVND